jgi:hypothetical protein
MNRTLRTWMGCLGASLALIGSISLLAPEQANAQARRRGQVDSLVAWCNDTIGLLDEYEASAWNLRRLYGPTRELQELENGLRAALQSAQYGYTGPLTFRAIERGLRYSAEMLSYLQGVAGADRADAYFLHEYYDFIRRVSREMDIPYFIPRTYCEECERRHGGGWEFEEERKLTEFARAQVLFVLRALVTQNGREIFPIGPTEAPTDPFLIALKLATGFAAADLRPGLFPTPNACAILHLEGMNRRIAQLLASETNEFELAFEFRRLVPEAEYWARQIMTPGGCRGYEGYKGNQP